MSISVTFSGVVYTIPVLGETPPSSPWGANLTSYFQALAANALPRSGGLFTINGSDLDLGATYGLKAVYLKTRGSNLATAGLIRFENAATGIGWRNAANSGNLLLTVNASDQLCYDGTPIGNVTVYTANRMLVTNGSGAIVVNAVTATEAGYLSGVTSSIQTQLNGKQAAGSYQASGNYVNNLYRSSVQQSVAASQTGQSLYSFTVPGGTISTNRRIRSRLYANLVPNDGAGSTNAVVTMKYGGSSAITKTVIFTNYASTHAACFDFDLCGRNNSAASQLACGGVSLQDLQSDPNISYAPMTFASISKDSTTDQTLEFTMDTSANMTALVFRCDVDVDT